MQKKGRRLYGPVLRELGDWIATTKAHSCKLLVVLIVYLEESITMDLHQLFAALRQRVRDVDIHNTVCIASSLVGRFVAPAAYLPLLLPLVRGDAITAAFSAAGPSAATNVGTRADALLVLSHFLRGTKASTVLPHLSDIVAVVCAEDLLFDACEGDATSTVALRLRRNVAAVIAALAAVVGERRSAAIDAHFQAKGRIIDVTASVRTLYSAALLVLPDALGATPLDALALAFTDPSSSMSSTLAISATEKASLTQKLRPKLVELASVKAMSDDVVRQLAAGEASAGGEAALLLSVAPPLLAEAVAILKSCAAEGAVDAPRAALALRLVTQLVGRDVSLATPMVRLALGRAAAATAMMVSDAGGIAAGGASRSGGPVIEAAEDGMSIATAVASNIDAAGNVASQRFSVGARATTLLLRLLDGETDASTVVAWSGEEADGLADAIGARSWPAATAKRLLQICVALQRPAHTLLWTRVVRRWSLADASSRDKISCNVYVHLNLHALQTIRYPFFLSLSLSLSLYRFVSLISFRLSRLEHYRYDTLAALSARSAAVSRQQATSTAAAIVATVEPGWRRSATALLFAARSVELASARIVDADDGVRATAVRALSTLIALDQIVVDLDTSAQVSGGL